MRSRVTGANAESSASKTRVHRSCRRKLAQTQLDRRIAVLGGGILRKDLGKHDCSHRRRRRFGAPEPLALCPVLDLARERCSFIAGGPANRQKGIFERPAAGVRACAKNKVEALGRELNRHSPKEHWQSQWHPSGIGVCTSIRQAGAWLHYFRLHLSPTTRTSGVIVSIHMPTIVFPFPLTW
jgi:hypothetical protein